MKKALSVLLCILMLLSSCVVSGYAQDEPLLIDVATDIHYSADSTRSVTQSTDDDPFGYTVLNGKMTVESAAIIDEFLKKAAADSSRYLIITGDLSDTGREKEILTIVAKLEQFEQTSGKTVLCLTGNHETYRKDTAKQFKEYYKNLGYDKALTVDSDSQSYTAELNGSYRLIAIDSNGFGESRMNWIEQQVNQAKKDGKQLIAITHFSLFSHYTIQQVAHDSLLSTTINVAEKFIEWGIKFCFTGHTHELDTAVYKNGNGEVYDIACGSVTTYPACYHTAAFSTDSVKIGTEYIEKIDSSLVPSGLCDTALSLLKRDFRAYAKNMFIVGSHKNFGDFLNTSYIKNALKLNAQTDADIIELLDVVIPRVSLSLQMPLYGKDGLQTISKKYNFDIPESEYQTALDVVCELYAEHCAGDENCPSYSPLGKVAFNSIASVLNYALEPLTAQQYSSLIKWALTKVNLPVNIPDSFVDITASGISKAEGIEYILLYVANPVLNNFTQDTAPDDVECTLSGYGKQQSQTATIMDKIKEWFRIIVAYIDSIFAFLKFADIG